MDLRSKLPSVARAIDFFKTGIGKAVLVAAFLFAPLVSIVMYWSQQYAELSSLEERVETLRLSAARSAKNAAIWENYIDTYGRASPYFVEKRIERFQLQKKEADMLSAIVSNPAFENHHEAQKQLVHLQSDANKLLFSEKILKETAMWKESLLTQLRPVQFGEEDFSHVLRLLEGRENETPQLFITSSSLRNVGSQVEWMCVCLKREVKE